MTPEELSARIAHLEEQERRQAADLRRQAADLRFTRRDLEMCREHLRLLLSGSERTIDRTKMDIDVSTQPLRVRMGAGRAKRDHAALRAFYRHGKTVTAIAAELGETRSRVDSWMRETGARPIPRKHRDYLRKTYDIPDAAWLNVEK